MMTNTTNLKPVLDWLTPFLRAERKRYNLARWADYDERRACQKVLAALVPCHRHLTVVVHEPATAAAFQEAPGRFARVLVEHFILKNTVVPEHAVWSMPVSGDLLRELIFAECPDGPEWLKWSVLYDDFKIWQVKRLEGNTLGELRDAFLAGEKARPQTEKEEIALILARVKGVLSEREFALLRSSMLVV